MTLKTVTLVTAIANSVALVAGVFGIVRYALTIMRHSSGGVAFAVSLGPWATSLIADAMLVIFLFALYARQKEQ